ncbi:MAG: Fe-S cluster assembly protein SufD [Hyphococcus sp.]
MSQSLLINPTAFEAGLQAAFQARAHTNPAQADAFDRFARRGMPNRRVEGWKWSDFHAVMRQQSVEPVDESASIIAPSPFAALNPLEFRIVNGRIELPEADALDGVAVDIIDPSATASHSEDHPIAALNVALTERALGLTAAKGARIERPILIRHVNSGPAPVFSQIVATVEEGARLTLIETFEGSAPFSSALLQLAVRDGAELERLVLQAGDDNAIAHGFAGVTVGKAGRFRQTSFSTGGKLCRHETHVLYPSAGARSEINSAALVGGARHSDFTTLVTHQGEACETRQLHKGVARARGSNVFQGKFLVERPAQQTDAKMTANALLLTDGAEANHKPELEIYADDVECAHGSTVGALDDDALFYLRQRGLAEDEARALLIDAFVGEVIEGIGDERAREIVHERVSDWLRSA